MKTSQPGHIVLSRGVKVCSVMDLLLIKKVIQLTVVFQGIVTRKQQPNFLLKH